MHTVWLWIHSFLGSGNATKPLIILIYYVKQKTKTNYLNTIVAPYFMSELGYIRGWNTKRWGTCVSLPFLIQNFPAIVFSNLILLTQIKTGAKNGNTLSFAGFLFIENFIAL